MSTKPYKGFEPKWMLQRSPHNTQRTIVLGADTVFC